MDSLLSYSWPGNVRELKNVVERAVYRSEGPLISEVDFNPFRNPFKPAGTENRSEEKEETDTPLTESRLSAVDEEEK